MPRRFGGTRCLKLAAVALGLEDRFQDRRVYRLDLVAVEAGLSGTAAVVVRAVSRNRDQACLGGGRVRENLLHRALGPGELPYDSKAFNSGSEKGLVNRPSTT
jgi:hypothetical protein